MSEMNSKILVVDDSISMRMIVVSFLKKMGYSNIHEAEDGEIALLMLKDGLLGDDPFQIVISDWFMPNMTGHELLEAVRKDEQLKNMPFLLVTAEGEDKHVNMAKESGVTDIIVKPFSIDQIHAKVKMILNNN